MDKSIGKMIAKIAAGLFIIASMFSGNDVQFSTVAVGLVVGLALIAWAIVPYLAEKKREKAMQDRLAATEEKRRRELEAQLKAEAEKPKYCSKCGATTKGKVCEYCGSPLDD